MDSSQAWPLSVLDIIAQIVAKLQLGSLAPQIMAPKQHDVRVRPEPKAVDSKPPAIHPSFIQVAKPFVYEQTIQDCLDAMGANRTREEALRLQGVSWIDNVRKALHLYVYQSQLHRETEDCDVMLTVLTALFEPSTLLWCIITGSALVIQIVNTIMWFVYLLLLVGALFLTLVPGCCRCFSIYCVQN